MCTSAIIETFSTPGLAQVGYVVGDPGAKVAVVIDPRRDVTAYLEWAEREGYTLIGALETHVHADFVSGAPALAEKTGATIYASRLGGVQYDHVAVDDGTVIEVGGVRLRAVFTPGHTPEHMSYLLVGEDQPFALFSGDSLFVGDVGRPDLLGESQTEGLARQLFGTVQNVFKTLPDDVIVYPGHTSGSSCGKQIGDDPTTTIGREKAGNYAFQPHDEQAFIAAVLQDMPPSPAYYPTLKKVNVVGGAKLEDVPAPAPISPAEVSDLSDDALIVDTRPAADFCAGTLPGALFAGGGADFAAWMGWFAPFVRVVVLIPGGEWSVDEMTAVMREMGLDGPVRWLDGELAEAGVELIELECVEVDDAAKLVEAGMPVIDVRSAAEYKDGHVPGAENVYAGSIVTGTRPADHGMDERLGVICESGYRSTVATSVLRKSGYSNLVNMSGGTSAWRDAGLAVEK